MKVKKEKKGHGVMIQQLVFTGFLIYYIWFFDEDLMGLESTDFRSETS